jgi:hypothetical protein
MPGLVTRGYGTGGPLVTRGLGFGPVPPGLLLPVSWFLVLQPGGVLGAANTDLIAAIYNYWYSNPTLTTAFPGGLKVRQSEFGTALPRCVVFKVGKTPSAYTTGDDYTFTQLVQFSIFASNYEDSRDKGYLVQNTYHKRLLTFANGYALAAFAGEPMEMPPEVAPGASEEFQHVVEVKYVVGRSVPLGA